jgi:hypothetical protein
MKTYRKKCEVCNTPFTSRYKHSRYCEKHRKNEKILRTPPEETYSCSICRKILEACGLGLDKLLAALEESPKKLRDEIDLSRGRYSIPVREPEGYENYIERLATKIDISTGLFREDLFSIKSLAKDSELSESTIKRHVHQHLVPARYLKKVERGFTIDTGLGHSLPRYHMYFDETQVHRSENVWYFGFEEEDIEEVEDEFRNIDKDLQLILERAMMLWIGTRLQRIERILQGVMNGDDLDVEEKAVKLFSVRTYLRQCLRSALSRFAPTLSKSGKDMGIVEEYVEAVEEISLSDADEMEEIEEITKSLGDSGSPLLQKSWVWVSVNRTVNAVMDILTLDAPTILIDRLLGPRSVVIEKFS